MHEVFINYRTKDGKETACLIDQALSERFGKNSAFLANKSIPPGAKYERIMLGAVRRSCVLLALMGDGWLNAPDRECPGQRALDNENDWVRREIEEALACGVLVVPLLLGRHVEQLDPRTLPPSMAELAECQYERFLLNDRQADLARLGDRLTAQVPELAALDTAASAARPAPQDPPHAPGPGPGVRNEGQSGGIGMLHGTLGTFVNEANAPLHTGSGDQIDTQINGEGTTHISGDNHGPIQHRFGSSRRYRGDSR